MLSKWKQYSIILIGISMILSYFWYVYYREARLQMHFLDIGQGDAIFIETPNKKQILIDGGPDKSVLHELGDVMPFWDRSIDYIILTHPDADHVVGLLEVLDRYEIKNIIDYGVKNDGTLKEIWNTKVKDEDGSYIKALNQTLRIDNLEIQIIHAGPDQEKSVNEKSVVTKVVYGGISALLTGDIGEKTEQVIMKENCEIRDCGTIQSTILKVAHHGSSHSSMKEFLEGVNPDIAIIQSGKENRFDHPHFEALKRFEQIGIPIVRNDQKGRITLFTDGRDIMMETER